MVRSNLRRIDEAVKSGILNDPKIIYFWAQYFDNQEQAKVFIERCLRKTTTRRMMLRVVWYSGVADGVSKIQRGRPALQISFLVAMAENIAKKKITKQEANKAKSLDLIQSFFKHISSDDESKLKKGLRRLLLNRPHHNFLLSSIVKILYQVRNNVFHGEEYWSFSLKEDAPRENDQAFNIITEGYLGTKKHRRRESLEVSITYLELRDIFIRTAINNINEELK